MKQLMNNDMPTILEMNIGKIKAAIEASVGEEVIITYNDEMADRAFQISDQQIDVTVNYYVNDECWSAKVTGVFLDDVQWYVMDRWRGVN